MNEPLEERRSAHRGMPKRLKVLAFLMYAAIIFLVGLLSYWEFYPVIPIKTYPTPYAIVYPENKIVKQGGYIAYEFTYDKYMDLMPTIQRQFVDGLVFNVSGTTDPTVGGIGRNIRARVQVPIPETLPPGKYHLAINATYELNPIRVFHNDNNTEVFEVIASVHTDKELDILNGELKR